MPTLHGQAIHHQLPADFAKHPNTPWDALRSIHVDPFIISIDSFSAATNVWSVDVDGIKLVTSLQPLLPGDILTRRAKGIFSVEHSLLIIAFDVPSNSTLPEKYHGGVIRAYNVPSGTLLQEVVLHGLALDQVFTASPSSTYLAAALSRPTQIALYQIHSQGLTELQRFTPPSLIPGLESFFPVHVGDDGAVLASSTAVPSPTLPLSLYLPTATSTDTREATLTLSDDTLDWLVPSGAVLTSSSSLVVAVSGTASTYDHRYTKSSVYALSLPSLSTTWKLDLEHGVTQLSYHSALGVVVAVHADSHHATLTLIDAQNGGIRRIVTLPPFPDTPHVPPRVRCTNKDEFVCVLPTGKLFVEPLRQILESGLSEDAQEKRTSSGEREDEGEEVVLKMQSAPVNPEPLNAKARKAGERWRWVDNAVLVPSGVVLLPIRGPEMFYVRW